MARVGGYKNKPVQKGGSMLAAIEWSKLWEEIFSTFDEIHYFVSGLALGVILGLILGLIMSGVWLKHLQPYLKARKARKGK